MWGSCFLERRFSGEIGNNNLKTKTGEVEFLSQIQFFTEIKCSANTHSELAIPNYLERRSDAFRNRRLSRLDFWPIPYSAKHSEGKGGLSEKKYLKIKQRLNLTKVSLTISIWTPVFVLFRRPEVRQVMFHTRRRWQEMKKKECLKECCQISDVLNRNYYTLFL